MHTLLGGILFCISSNRFLTSAVVWQVGVGRIWEGDVYMLKTSTLLSGGAGTRLSIVDLEELIRDLQESGIYAGVQTSKHGLEVWICGKSYTVRVDDVISTKEKAAAAYWLHIQAMRLFPESAYAQRWERRIPSRGAPPATL